MVSEDKKDLAVLNISLWNSFLIFRIVSLFLKKNWHLAKSLTKKNLAITYLISLWLLLHSSSKINLQRKTIVCYCTWDYQNSNDRFRFLPHTPFVSFLHLMILNFSRELTDSLEFSCLLTKSTFGTNYCLENYANKALGGLAFLLCFVAQVLVSIT